MVICLDVGNTNICIGFFESNKLINKFRFCTKEYITSDEYGIKFLQLLDFCKINKEDIEGIIISSVAPKVDYALKEMAKKYFRIDPIFVGQGTKSGIKIKLDNPKQLGADLLVGAVGAVEKYDSKVLVIDIGTAMTFVYVNENKEFLGGAIVPGIRTAFSELTNKTSLLEKVGLEDVNDILGKSTKTCIQSGMVFGWTSLIEGMIRRYQNLFGDFKVVMTGGESRFVYKHIDSSLKVIYDEDLLLDGLIVLYNKNKR